MARHVGAIGSTYIVGFEAAGAVEVDSVDFVNAA